MTMTLSTVKRTTPVAGVVFCDAVVNTHFSLLRSATNITHLEINLKDFFLDEIEDVLECVRRNRDTLTTLKIGVDGHPEVLAEILDTTKRVQVLCLVKEGRR